MQKTKKFSPVYLNVYSIERHYGGAEGGGWWWDSGDPLESVSFDNREEAEAQIEAYKAKWADDASGDIQSVLGGNKIEVYIEQNFAQYFPETRPTYC